MPRHADEWMRAFVQAAAAATIDTPELHAHETVDADGDAWIYLYPEPVELPDGDVGALAGSKLEAMTFLRALQADDPGARFADIICSDGEIVISGEFLAVEFTVSFCFFPPEGVDAVGVLQEDGSVAPIDDATEASEDDPAGEDDFVERQLFKCSWPNGDVSFVLAVDEDDAIEELDEVDSATPDMLQPVTIFMAHFNPQSPRAMRSWAFEGFGERTEDVGGPLGGMTGACEAWAKSAEAKAHAARRDADAAEARRAELQRKN